jgi:fructose-1,6-bisphosphatase/inositol monophosphatase family enzyme
MSQSFGAIVTQGSRVNLNQEKLDTYYGLALQAAKGAGEIISSYQPAVIAKIHKSAGNSPASQVVTEVDYHAEREILRILHPTFSEGIGLLTEESEDDLSRLSRDYFWCIDPLDGTLPFVQGRSGYAVSIGLVSKSGVPILGVVYDPVHSVLYRACKGKGAYKNDVPISPHRGVSLATIESWDVNNSTNALMRGVKEIDSGGAVMNACGVLELALLGKKAVFMKHPKQELGGGCIWDYAATSCIYKECGLWVSDAFGKELFLNSKETLYFNKTGVLFASDALIAKQAIFP